MQRLFSTFPNSWPGLGLLILRFAAGLSLAAIAHHAGEFAPTVELPVRIMLLAVAVLIWLGLWTPLAAVTGAAFEILMIFLGHGFDLSLLIFAALVLSLAMLGPGAWSLDARLFGRKRIM